MFIKTLKYIATFKVFILAWLLLKQGNTANKIFGFVIMVMTWTFVYFELRALMNKREKKAEKEK